MEIMGGLVKLQNPNMLPIPWFMRPHLGLETGAKVWFAATKPEKAGRLPDIVLTPLDPRQLNEITRATLSNAEGIGTLANVLQYILPPVNIALADSVTLENRDTHRINLVLEQAQSSNTKDYIENRNEFIRRFTRVPDEKPYGLEHTPLYPQQIPILYTPIQVTVSEGQIKIGSILREIIKDYKEIAEDYDFSRIVVSSNPDQRLIRYIIPRKGIVTFRLEHEDKPGVLHKLVDRIAEYQYNILCSRLSRANSDSKNCSMFVCECEPSDRDADPNKLISGLKSASEIHKGTFNRGVPAKDSLYPKPIGSMNVRPHSDYRVPIEKMEAKLRGKKPLFISRRFVEGKTKDFEILRMYRKVLEEVRRGAVAAGWEPLEAPPEDMGELIDKAVFPRLWLSRALLVMAFFEDGSGKISLNQANELGFALAQNEPAVILVDGTKFNDLRELSNYAGRTLFTYSVDTAFESDDPGSIRNKVKTWLEGLAVEGDD